MRILSVILLVLVVTGLSHAQTDITPILEMKLGGLLGGVQNGKFIDAKTTAAKITKTAKYNLFGVNGAKNNTLTATIEAPDVPCENFYSVETTSKNALGIAVGTGANWKLFPRNPAAIALNSRIYKKVVANILRSKGLPRSIVKITQAFRVDLEGDGTEEILIAATSYKNGVAPRAEKGDYSFLLMRKIVGGKAQDIVLDGDFITKKIEFGAPSQYEFSAIADLNGDGKLEVVIFSQYYEGSSAAVYEMVNGKLKSVLETGCGV